MDKKDNKDKIEKGSYLGIGISLGLVFGVALKT